jgi:hypothetical protein
MFRVEDLEKLVDGFLVREDMKKFGFSVVKMPTTEFAMTLVIIYRDGRVDGIATINILPQNHWFSEVNMQWRGVIGMYPDRLEEFEAGVIEVVKGLSEAMGEKFPTPKESWESI